MQGGGGMGRHGRHGPSKSGHSTDHTKREGPEGQPSGLLLFVAAGLRHSIGMDKAGWSGDDRR